MSEDDFFIVTLEWSRQGHAEEMYRVQTLLGRRPDAELLAYAITVATDLQNFGGVWADFGRELVIHRD